MRGRPRLYFSSTQKLARAGGDLKLGFLVRVCILITYPQKLELGTGFFAYQNIQLLLSSILLDFGQWEMIDPV